MKEGASGSLDAMGRSTQAAAFVPLYQAAAVVSALRWPEDVVHATLEKQRRRLSDHAVRRLVSAMEILCLAAEDSEESRSLDGPVARRAEDGRPTTAEELRDHIRSVVHDGGDGRFEKALDEVEVHRDVVLQAVEGQSPRLRSLARQEPGDAEEATLRPSWPGNDEADGPLERDLLGPREGQGSAPLDRPHPDGRKVSGARVVAEIADALVEGLQSGDFASKEEFYDELHRRAERTFGRGACSRKSVERRMREVVRRRLGRNWHRFLTAGRRRS